MTLGRQSYAVISPMRDEGAFIAEIMGSMIHQTLKPVAWIIVDDGSTDQSVPIAAKIARGHPWIILKLRKRRSARQTGSAEVQAFRYGLTFLKHIPYDFIVKLDCDVRFEEGYFADLLGKFTENPQLGIASGIYLERRNKGWVPITMPAYHAAGASKVIRAECFHQIDGLIPFRGWDTVDEIKANHKGWDTCHFPDLRFFHLKDEGTGMGLLHTSSMHGEIFYRTTGGYFGFFLLKFAARLLTGKPFILSGLLLLYGYARAKALRMPLLVTKEEAATYRSLLIGRLSSFLAAFRAKRPAALLP